MSDLIRIVGVKAKGFHGVLESEQKRGQKFIVDAELRLTLSKLNDDLSDYNKHYEDLYEEKGEKVTLKAMEQDIKLRDASDQGYYYIWFCYHYII